MNFNLNQDVVEDLLKRSVDGSLCFAKIDPITPDRLSLKVPPELCTVACELS